MVLLMPLPPTVSPGQHTADSVVSAGNFVRENAGPGPVLASIPIVAVEAGREVVRGTEMGQFSVMAPPDAPSAARLHLTTLAELTALVERREPAAIVIMAGNHKWNFRWQVPRLTDQPAAAYETFERAMWVNYTMAHRAGGIEVLLPRTE
jgi:hypothetical protein